MAILNLKTKIGSGSQVTLPSPVSIEPKIETIWSSDTGRTSSGKMVGTVVDEKRTVSVKWSNLTKTQMQTIKNNCPKGFFDLYYYEIGSEKHIKVYRSTLTYKEFEVGDGNVYYTDVSCEFIEQ